MLQKILPANFRKKLKQVLYRGSRYQCPFCGGNFDRLIDAGQNTPAVLAEKQVVGAGFRKHCYCPKCSSSDRERLLYVYIAEESDLLDQPGRVLHIAPERNLSKFLAASPGIDYVCGDISPDDYSDFDQLVKVDVTDIPFADNEFDVVLCNHVLEHVDNDHLAMTELHRVMKPGGRAILQVPISLTEQDTHEDPTVTDPAERDRLFGQHNHVRLYGQDYPSRLENAGFTVTPFQTNTENRDRLARYATNPDEDVFVVTK